MIHIKINTIKMIQHIAQHFKEQQEDSSFSLISSFSFNS